MIKLMDLLQENITSDLKKLIGVKNVKWVIGNSTESKTTPLTKQQLDDYIQEILTHVFYDGDFELNWTSLGKEYRAWFNSKAIPIVKKKLNKIITIDGDTVAVKTNYDTDGREIDKLMSAHTPKNIYADYKQYRDEYAGVTLK